MASEYLKWKYKDVQPDKPLVLTKKQKWNNWWHYHKWHVIIGAVLLITALSILRYALGVGMTKPDWQVAYVGAAPLPDNTVAALEKELAAYGEDITGDGKVVFKINQYPTASMEEGADAAAYAAASAVKLMGDLESRQSCLFLLDDAETFQQSYDVLADKSGAIAGSDKDIDAYKWSSCPVLCALKLGSYTEQVLGKDVTGDSSAVLSELTLARYGAIFENDTQKEMAYDDLWNALTKGAEK